MTLYPDLVQAIEQLDYRVTVGDVAAKAGLDVNQTQRGLLTLASDAGGHLQVAESGEIVYLFPRDFRAILHSKHLRLRLQEWAGTAWKVLFYLIRVSFGIALLVSITLIFLSILIIISAATRSDSGGFDGGGGGDGGGFSGWFGPNFVYIFSPGYYDRSSRAYYSSGEKPSLGFFQAVFSFLFGDGNPNRDLDERRWRAIGTVIRNNRGAIAAEQIAPYLDNLGRGHALEYEEYMLPVLSRFDGRPQVSPNGDIVYHFPELQAMAAQHGYQAAPAYLKELLWRFSQASPAQIAVAIGLGLLNVGGALFLGHLLAGGAAAGVGLIAFVKSIYWALLTYGSAFLTIPLVRFFWLKGRNRAIARRNEERQERVVQLNQADDRLQAKLAYAQTFAAETVIDSKNLAYSTERDLADQELAQSDQIDAEWRRRLEQGQ
jgi:hypothetical protein